MAFEFGLISGLDSTTSTIAFLLVVVFIVFFEFVTGFLEFFCVESDVYNQMIQKIYKELMLMGIVSFSVIMVEANAKTDSHTVWIVGIDFSHILLFYVAIFFVVHAFYIMGISFSSSREYIRMNCVKVDNLIEMVQANTRGFVLGFLFLHQYFPFSNLRDQVEFKLTHHLFMDTYWLPESFDFAAYLTGCFERYALKTIDRGLLSWAILVLLCILNFLRIHFNWGFDCNTSFVHMHYPAYIMNSNASGILLEDQKLQYFDERNLICSRLDTKLFSLSGALLIFYSLFMLWVARTYQIRLIRRVGVANVTDYADFLKFSENTRQQNEAMQEKERLGLLKIPVAGRRVSVKALKNDIEGMLDEQEHSDEIQFYKRVAAQVVPLTSQLRDTAVDILINTRLLIVGIIWPSRVKPTIEQAVIFATTDEDTTAPKVDASRQSMVANSKIREFKSRLTQHRSTKMEDIIAQHMAGKAASVRATTTTTTTTSAATSADDTAAAENPPQTASVVRRDLKSMIHNMQAKMPPPSALQEVDEDNSSSSDSEDSKDEGGGKVTDTRAADGAIAPALLTRPSAIIMAVKPEPAVTLAASKPDNHVIDILPSPALPLTPAPRTNSSPAMSTTGAPPTSFHGGILGGGGGGGPSAGLITSRCRDPKRRGSVNIAKIEEHISTVEQFRRLKINERRASMAVLPMMAPKKPPVQRFKTLAKQVIMINKLGGGANRVQNDPAPGSDAEAVQGAASAASVAAVVPATADEYKLSDDFSDIFFMRRPDLFYQAVELCLMLNCFYLAMWATNFITIVNSTTQYKVLWQILMLIPVTFILPCIGRIAKICSMLQAISELNLEVILQVLVEMEDMKELKSELREKILERLMLDPSADKEKKALVIKGLFEEIDSDGSGNIDKAEFRKMLRGLRLHFSDERFRRLFRAVDMDGDGQIQIQEMNELMFPYQTPGQLFQEEQRLAKLNIRASIKEQAKQLVPVAQSSGGSSSDSDSDEDNQDAASVKSSTLRPWLADSSSRTKLPSFKGSPGSVAVAEVGATDTLKMFSMDDDSDGDEDDNEHEVGMNLSTSSRSID